MGLMEKDKMLVGLVALWFVCMVASCATLSHADGGLSLSFAESSLDAKVGDLIDLDVYLSNGDDVGISGASVEACCESEVYAFVDQGDGNYKLAFDTGNLRFSGEYSITVTAQADGYGSAQTTANLSLAPKSDQTIAAAIFGGVLLLGLGFVVMSKTRN